MKHNLHTSFSSFNANKIYESAEEQIQIDDTIIDKLIDLVGSEEDVEECAKDAFEELQKAFERGEVEAKEGPFDKLALSALIVKLVEKGKIGPHDADSFIEEYL